MSALALNASLFAAKRRPGIKAISAVWLLGMMALFGYGVLYIVYKGLSSSANPANDPEEIIKVLLPQNFAAYTTGLYPLYGAVMLILGALVAGGEYRWGTLSTVLTQRSNRTSVFLGHWLVLLMTLLTLTVATFCVTGGASMIIALVESRPVALPAAGQLLGAIAAGWLISTALATLGFFLAVAFRGITAAVAIGLLWTPGIENLINVLTSSGPPFSLLQKVLIAPNAGSLAVGVGVPRDTPGVFATSSPALAAVTLIGYVAVLMIAALWLVNRRDVPR